MAEMVNQVKVGNSVHWQLHTDVQYKLELHEQHGEVLLGAGMY